MFVAFESSDVDFRGINNVEFTQEFCQIVQFFGDGSVDEVLADWEVEHDERRDCKRRVSLVATKL